MLSEDFKNAKIAYRVRVTDIQEFLNECDELGYRWLRGGKALDFDPFKFYEGDKIEYLRPVQTVEDPNWVYIRCFNGNLDFSFQSAWYVHPFREYSPP